MIYCFVRVAEDRWELFDQTIHPGPDEDFVHKIVANDQLAKFPWTLVVCLEDGAIQLSELFTFWGMAPGSDPLDDRNMQRFWELAKGKTLTGDQWQRKENKSPVVQDNLIVW